jgi:GNAT superfamily N-acetyltransferase|tara:strand:+ start:573 stop:1004 length:432 start_codon:yes stop_codon:yes gene_type:complete
MIDQPRRGSIDDAARCAEILNKWVEITMWMPRLYSKNELLKMIEEAIPLRELWVIGNPALAYVSFNNDLSQVVALYSDKPGRGYGKVLLDKVKEGREYIQLWSHSANESAHRFYHREGFKTAAYKEKGDDGISEIQFEWYSDR